MSLTNFVPTKSSMSKANAESEFESISFISYKKKNSGSKQSNEEKNLDSKATSNAKSLNIKKLRYEVIRLGTSGMDPSKKESSNVALAVALGAKPPKNKYRNYKEILEEKKKSKGSGYASSKEPAKPSHRHLYVVRDKVIPAKPEKVKKGMKNFLERYGKVGKGSGGRRKKADDQ